MSSFPSRPSESARSPADRYRILGRIAAGGMAEIYLARMASPTGADREVVLKRLMPELQGDVEFVQMFHDEARIASQMRHPSIVQIYELGELDGSLFISMELLRGVNLRDLLARLMRRRVELPLPLAMRIACGALEALAYAHEFTDASGRLLNVVHRDVSPQNIIVTYDGGVKLVDFGVAKAEGRLHQTRAGLIKGKFAYMSPEQIEGGKIDARSDLFALAEVIYELTLRRHPFYAKTDMDVLRGIIEADPPPPTTVDPRFPSALSAILMRALRKSPGDRYASARVMLDAMQSFLESIGGATAPQLGRFVRETFSDRLEKETHARQAGDDRLLVDALSAGKTDPSRVDEKKRGPVPRVPAYEADETEPGGETYGLGRVRDQVIEISPSEAIAEDTAAPAFAADSEYTQPGAQRARLKLEVRELFADPADPAEATAAGPSLASYAARAPEPDDPGEAPTMTGALSDSQLAEIRGLRPVRPDPRVTAFSADGFEPTPRVEPPTTELPRMPRGSALPRVTDVTTRDDASPEDTREDPIRPALAARVVTADDAEVTHTGAAP
ncbi:serine/threonine protein kinase, partial [Myxococcota bacterium]|nr:serine/threonine protein kinase [Myxococcota bacterium]